MKRLFAVKQTAESLFCDKDVNTKSTFIVCLIFFTVVQKTS